MLSEEKLIIYGCWHPHNSQLVGGLMTEQYRISRCMTSGKANATEHILSNVTDVVAAHQLT